MRNAATGQNYVYPMKGRVIKATEGYVRTVADTQWQIMATGDYDGDGKADISVFRPSTGQWFQQRSTSGFFATQFGQNGDKPRHLHRVDHVSDVGIVVVS